MGIDGWDQWAGRLVRGVDRVGHKVIATSQYTPPRTFSAPLREGELCQRTFPQDDSPEVLLAARDALIRRSANGALGAAVLTGGLATPPLGLGGANSRDRVDQSHPGATAPLGQLGLVVQRAELRGVKRGGEHQVVLRISRGMGELALISAWCAEMAF